MSAKKLTEKVVEKLLKKESKVLKSFVREVRIVKDSAVFTEAKALSKSAYGVNLMDSGEMKMEFGPEVPELVKKRAMEWAKKRGLRVKESSLGKSESGFEWVIFSN
jgi:hypothetical protein